MPAKKLHLSFSQTAQTGRLSERQHNGYKFREFLSKKQILVKSRGEVRLKKIKKPPLRATETKAYIENIMTSKAGIYSSRSRR